MSWLSGNRTATAFTKPNPFNPETGYHHQISEPEHLEEEHHHLRSAIRGNEHIPPKVSNKRLEGRQRTRKMRKIWKQPIFSIYKDVQIEHLKIDKICLSLNELQEEFTTRYTCYIKICQTVRARHIRTRLKEHKCHLRNNSAEKSAMTEHAVDTGYLTDLNSIKFVVKQKLFWPRLYREAIEMNV